MSMGRRRVHGCRSVAVANDDEHKALNALHDTSGNMYLIIRIFFNLNTIYLRLLSSSATMMSMGRSGSRRRRDDARWGG
jgi:hypothetical protein